MCANCDSSGVSAKLVIEIEGEDRKEFMQKLIETIVTRIEVAGQSQDVKPVSIIGFVGNPEEWHIMMKALLDDAKSQGEHISTFDEASDAMKSKLKPMPKRDIGEDFLEIFNDKNEEK